MLNYKTPRFLLVIILFITCQKTVLCQGTMPRDPVFDNLSRAITALDNKIFEIDENKVDGAKYMRMRSSFVNIKEMLQHLTDLLLDRQTKHDTAWLKNIKELVNYTDLLQQVTNTDDLDQMIPPLAFINDDLALKKDAAFGASTTNTIDLVVVHIRVLNGSGQQLSGYIPVVKPELSLNKDQYETFNPTNNAIKKITPGRKSFWIEKEGVVIQKRLERIRLDDSAETLIDFVVN